jgi:hypothetical protein
MTYMEVLAVRDNGDVTDYDEAHNSWGGAMHIWMKLAQKYDIPFSFSEEGFKKIWQGIVRMSEPDQWVMASTFDMMIVPKEDLLSLTKYWKVFCERYPSDTLREAIVILERASQDEQVQGICFNHTSIVDSWSVPSENEQEGSRPYNINLDHKHKYLNADYISQCV